jgi:CRP-like cAMP-binding protein
LAKAWLMMELFVIQPMIEATEVPHGQMPSLAEAIVAHPFAADMKPEHLKKLVGVAMFKQFERDQVVFREGEPANRFYLICRGKIALECRSGGPSVPVVQFIGEGEVLGWSWLFPPYYWHFNAVAREPTRTMFFYGSRLSQQCDRNHEFGYELIKGMSQILIAHLQADRERWIEAAQVAPAGAAAMAEYLVI